MPKKNETRVPKVEIAKFVKRYLEGEAISDLTAAYKVSRATGYNWIARHQNRIVSDTLAAKVGADQLDQLDKKSLIAEVKSLRIENQKLRDRLMTELLKNGSI